MTNGVAYLTAWTQINNRTLPTEIDVAIASTIPRKVNSSGSVLSIGQPYATTQHTAVDPSIGMSVIKSGRTTGLTSGTVVYVHTSVVVTYDTPSGGGYDVLFNDCFFVSGKRGSFSNSGDSGSLILKTDTMPIGLLFAGNSQYTVGFPIKKVLARIEKLTKSTVTIVGKPPTRQVIKNIPKEMTDKLKDTMDVKDKNVILIQTVKNCVGVGVHYDPESSEHGIVIFMYDPERDVSRSVDVVSAELLKTAPELNLHNPKIIYLDEKIKANNLI
jgi:hypothetical protein